MEQNNTTAETYLTNESQDISSSQQESTVSDGAYGYDDGNESSSLRDSPHEEVVNSAIMEVSGELMLGKLTPNKHPSVCSESSDMSDDDFRHHVPGGVIAKYPESSTGLSDNDWNPYATESDTNQTPRSPRSNTSDDNRIGFISKASIQVKAIPQQIKDTNMGESVGLSTLSDKETVTASITVNGSYSPEQTRSENEDLRQYATMLSEREDLEMESPDTAPDTARSANTEDSRSGRQSLDSLPIEEYKQESQVHHTELSSVKHSLESGPLDGYRKLSAESSRSLSQESGDNSSQPSVETVRHVRGSISDLERTAESYISGRQSVESYNSQRSSRSQKINPSEQSQRSNQTQACGRFDRSDRLEQLSDAAGDNLKELMQFESAQRPNSDRSVERDALFHRERTNFQVSSTRLTATVESLRSPPERSTSGYVCVAERERLISDSPVHDQIKNQGPMERKSFESDSINPLRERSKPNLHETNVPTMPDATLGRSPSEASMRRVSNLFEETKRQVREAVAIPRPDPSGSEERFPLKERLSWKQHNASFNSQGTKHTGEFDNKTEEKLEKPKESEAARSLTSEEVARVLSKYSLYEKENMPKENGVLHLDMDNKIKVSAFDTFENRGQEPIGIVNGTLDGSDDELSKRVKAILAGSHKLDNIPVKQSRTSNLDYIPNTIDYSRLHKDLEEIQDSLHDIPKSMANDSLPLHLDHGKDHQDSPIPSEFVIKSMETTGNRLTRSRESEISECNGRESGASEYGRKLVWDHGADLQYDPEYDGKFLATNTSTETLINSRKRYSSDGSSDTLVIRPDSVATNATEYDGLDYESEGAKTRTGCDITRAERIVQQVMNRQAEGDLKENVEDIIARYRTERRDLDDRFQPDDSAQVTDIATRNRLPDITPAVVPQTEVQKSVSHPARDTKEIGLAERVYNILSADSNNLYERPDEQGDRSMASEVSNILAKGRPHQQVDGILTNALAHESEMLKKMAAKEQSQMVDSSLEDSGVNDSQESYALDDCDVRKCLQWSQMSSPEKGGDKSYLSEWNSLRQVTKAPYSSVNNAKTLLSTQLKKMSERNFDKSVEMRTPFRQAIQCWPVHGVERTGEHLTAAREAWMPRLGVGSSEKEKKSLERDRFYITDTFQQPDARRPRTYSDPFEVSHTPHLERDPHPRSRSEEPLDLSDLSQYSELPQQYSPTARRSASSPTWFQRKGNDEFMTPKSHKPEDSCPVIASTDSDTSVSRRPARPRPYRPAGSRDMYYTESGDDTNESGTTVESTHPGSDDAIPPYIPHEYLGTRREEQNKHPTGIYGVNGKPEDLPITDENLVKDEKEKALPASIGSKMGNNPDKEDEQSRRSSDSIMKVKSNTQYGDTGYQTGSSSTATHAHNTGYPSRSRISSKSDLERDSRFPPATGSTLSTLKSREQFLREFEEREQGRPSGGEQRDQMGTSVRSDPGGALDDLGSRIDYRQSTDGNEFRVMEPEPGYPQERLRYSRSRSDTDLVSLSPNESQRYSSPMQPGTRFMELSTQPSPIFHHDSLTIAPRSKLSQETVEEQRFTGRQSVPLELPRVDDRRDIQQLPRVDDRRKTPPIIERRETRSVEPLEPGEEPDTLNQRSKGQAWTQELMEPVDLGADPTRLGDIPRSRRPKTQAYTKQKEMEAELEKMNKDLTEQVKELQEGKSENKDEDREPLSKKAQVLRQVLEQDYVEGIPPNINDMWTRFKEKFDQSVSESSVNSTRLEALSGLIQNPTHHFVNSFLHEKKQETEVQKRLDEKNAERIRGESREESKRLKRMSEIRATEERMAEIRAAEERSERRDKLRQKHSLSEEESNGSIIEMLVEIQKKKERKHTKERNTGDAKRRKTPDKMKKEKAGKNCVDKETETNIKSRPRVQKDNILSDTVDTLFSIPEDASFDQSPNKSESELRSRQRRQRHVIDPLMKKLRDKIKLQRVKIDKERRKELQRVEKLKKLEMLLNAKRQNHLSDKAIDVELQNVSTTTSVQSDTTLISTDSTLHAQTSSHDSDQSFEISTTLKDSTVSPITLRVKRYPELEKKGSLKGHYVDKDSTDSSDLSNIIVERLRKSKSISRKSDRKSEPKERKVKLDENGQRIRKERKMHKNKEVFGVEVSDEDLNRQVQQYKCNVSPVRQRVRTAYVPHQRQTFREKTPSPDRHRQLKDASTMYPSPITVSPPQSRKMRDVLMRSEAIQTSPSIRSRSPFHSYDEVPVSPVPTMSSIRPGKKSSQRRPSPSPKRYSTNTRSVKSSPPRGKSKSPPAKTFSRPSVRGMSSSPPRQRKDPPMWKPESECSPPENSMFTPEGETKQDKIDEATCWFIPMKPVQPWRKPLKERQAFSVQQENWEPTSISQKQWRKMVHGGIEKEQVDQNDVSRDTKFDLDPEGQPINEESGEESEDTDLNLSNSKPLSKMTLQEAFMLRKQMAISGLRERQKRLNLAAEERKMEAYLKMERDRLFSEERKKEANPEAHPYSDNLYKPARRVISKEEMKELTVKRYKKLPEVIEKQKLQKREEEYNLNRLKARLYNRKIQKNVLVKAQKWGR